MKLRTLLENPALFMDVRDLIEDLADVAEPDSPTEKRTSGMWVREAQEIKEKWERLDK